ncbi:MAG: UDP-N-acetylmuramoyl-L-alanine--D-glutamate ligase [Pseudomonadota bacterium]|nr:UDP-N-acetylmuramoyl-L-alanine--D-glutamate ligase [Pseudomonadota bacterium]
MFAIVVGAGITGKSASSYLAQLGADVLLYDDQRVDYEHEQVNITTDLAQARAELKRAAMMVISPSVPLTHELVSLAHAQQVRVVSEVDLAVADYRGVIIAVTGTNGKSTVCQYIQHLLRKHRCDSALAGNIGVPITSVLRKHCPDYLVLELSSYQLAQSHLPPVKVAVFTNFSADHLQYHRDLATYFRAKSSIFASAELAISDVEVYHRSPQPHHIVVSEHDTTYHVHKNSTHAHNAKNRTSELHQQLAATSAFATHDLSNAVMALLAVEQAIGVASPQLVSELDSCEKPPHRLQHIGMVNGYPVVNDSKATNIGATLAALRAQSQPVLLIVGGLAKRQIFLPLLTYRAKINGLYIFGADGEQIYTELAPHLPCKLFPNLAAVMRSLQAELSCLASGVLFSPACATDGEFRDFVARGEAFVGWVQQSR